MKVILPLTLLILIAVSSFLSGQDAHMSNYRTSANFFNPAETGDFLGFIKVHGTLRTQYERVYEHGIAGAEVNMFSPLRKQDWVSCGINLLFDRTGNLSYNTAGGSVQFAYHLALDKKRNNVIGLGGSFDYQKLTISGQNYRSETTITGGQDPDLNGIANFSGTLRGINAGVNITSRFYKNSYFKAGVAAVRLNAPNYTIVGKQNDASHATRININAAYCTPVSKVFTLEPAAFMSFSEHQSNINLQLISGWKLSPKHSWQIVTGLTHRLNESVGLIAGFSSKKTYLSLSFDIITGQVSQVTQNPGALELGLYHIFYRYTRPAVKPVIFCNRL